MTQYTARDGNSFRALLTVAACGLAIFLHCQVCVDAARLPAPVQTEIEAAEKGGGMGIGAGWANATGHGSTYGDNTDENIVATASSSGSSTLIVYPDGSFDIIADGQGVGQATGNIAASSQGPGSQAAGGALDLDSNGGGSGTTILSRN